MKGIESEWPCGGKDSFVDVVACFNLRLIQRKYLFRFDIGAA
jgi:hypothetical protein